MVFSLFGKRSEPKRGRSASTPIPPAMPVTPTRPKQSLQAQRELARRTAQKIDEIESEMQMESHRLRGADDRDDATDFNQRAEDDTDFLGDVSTAGSMSLTVSNGPPVVEEAAILFANGQIEGAQAALEYALTESDPGAGAHQIWLMLLDLLMVRGDDEAFEGRALQFAEIFETSPPVPPANRALLKKGAKSNMPTTTLSAGLEGMVARSMESLLKSADKGPVKIDFANVKRLTAEGVAAVASAVAQLEKTRKTVHVAGVASMIALLEAELEGCRDDNYWALAFWLHRVQGDMEAYDNCSLNYAIALEVSPPAWTPMIGSITMTKDAAPAADTGPSIDAKLLGTRMALIGTLEGRIEPVLQKISDYAAGREKVEIDCRQLARVDFASGGSLMNTLVGIHASGKRIVLFEPNQLVAALCVVMGLHEVVTMQMAKV